MVVRPDSHSLSLTPTHTHSHHHYLCSSAEQLRAGLGVASKSRLQIVMAEQGAKGATAALDTRAVRQLVHLGVLARGTGVLSMYRIHPEYLDFIDRQLERCDTSPYHATRAATLTALRKGLVEAALPPRLLSLEGEMDPEEPPLSLFADFDLMPRPPYYIFDRDLTEGLTLLELQQAGRQHLEDDELEGLTAFYQARVVDLSRVVQLNALLSTCGALEHHPQGYSTFESFKSHMLVPLWQYLGR